jgi:hypothetical protein
MVKKKKPKMVFLMETKSSSHCMEIIRPRTGFESVFVVESVGRSGGLALMWSSYTNVEIQNYSQHHINAIVQMEANDVKWKLTGFYGHSNANKRIEAWNLLHYLDSFSLEAWLCFGDFNEKTEDSEKVGGLPKARRQMENFCNTINHCQLYDLGYRGSRFTWCNMQHNGDFVKECLDRALANDNWRDNYPMQTVEVLANRSSDHTPLFLKFSKVARRKKKKKRKQEFSF